MGRICDNAPALLHSLYIKSTRRTRESRVELQILLLFPLLDKVKKSNIGNFWEFVRGSSQVKSSQLVILRVNSCSIVETFNSIMNEIVEQKT